MTCDENIITALLASVNSIEQELGPDPEGIYASVRTRLDILEARINNPYAPAPNVTNPFYIGGSPVSGVSIQDGYGDPNVLRVPALPGSLWLRGDGNSNLYSLGQDGYWNNITFLFLATGDLEGTSTDQIVIGIQGNPVSNIMPTAGQFLIENSSHSGSVWTTISGDIVASTSTVGKLTVMNINGTSVPSGPSANQVLVATSGTASIWEQISNAQISNSAAIAYSKLNLIGNIVNSDINTSASIAVNKLATGVSAQILLNNATPTPTWTTLTGDVAISNVGITTVNKIQGVVISGVPATGYVLEATSAFAASWQAPSGDIILGGDVSGPAPSNTVTKIQGNTITSGPLTKGQFLAATSATNWAATTLSGDIVESTIVPGQLAVVGLDGYALPTPSGINTVLEFNAGAFSWTSLPSSLPPSGGALGDLSGTYPSPAVIGLNGVPLPGLTDGYLNYNGTSWQLSTLPASLPPDGYAGGDLTGIFPNPTVAALFGNPLSTLPLDLAEDGYILTWTGLLWAAEPANVEATNTIVSSYQINSSQNDYHIYCNFSAPGSVTFPVPINGVKFEIWDISGSASSNTITLLPYDGESIFFPNTLSASITTNYGHLSAVSNGTNWFLSP